MTARRRALVLLALAAVLGTLAASDVSRREAALRRGLGPPVPVLVARVALPAGTRLSARGLTVRTVPARFAPARAFRRAGQVLGLRTTVALPAGADLQPELVGYPGARGAGGPALRPGETVAEVVAAAAIAEIPVGSSVDVLVSGDGGDASGVVVSDAQVISIAAVSSNDPGPHVTAQLRVSRADGISLGELGSGAEIRLLPRPQAPDGGS